MQIHDLIARLAVEMYQTEESAKEHPRKEAERLAGTPPAAAMLAVSAHAERALEGMERIGLRKRGVGVALGKTFSVVREALVDHLMSQEKNYRGTLLGMQHGLDLFLLAEAAARHAGEQPLAEFCRLWLDERRPLVEAVRAHIPWFAENLEHAE